MTQYLLSVWHTSEDDHNGTNLSEEEMQLMFKQVGAFNDELMKNGQWVFGGGLHAPSSATSFRFDKGTDNVTMTDGPFAETKEQIGGFWVIKADDLDVALDLGRRASIACRGPVEVRPFQDEPSQ
jgi:hypothetical protein